MKLTDILHQIGDRVRLFARVIGLTGGTSVVDSIVVTNGGNNYTSPPTVNFTGGGGTGAAATAVLSGGRVVRVDVTNPGSGYTSVPTVSFTIGGGSGAAATAVLLGEKLDAIPTVNIALAPITYGAVIIAGVISFYRLRAGTDATSLPNIIRPTDYAGGTNEKVWEMTGTNPGAGGQVYEGATEPPAITPAFPLSGAIYTARSGTIYMWRVDTQVWQ
jgi:hypothetical protein